MQRSTRRSQNKVHFKDQNSSKVTGKKNLKSKKTSHLLVSKDFAEDHHLTTNLHNQSLKKDQSATLIHQKHLRLHHDKDQNPNDKTQKKLTTASMSQPSELKTVSRRKKLKSLCGNSKRNQYVYMIIPQTKKMKKYLIHQGEDINLQLDTKEEYIPPFQSCDEDCDSTEQIVRKGVEYSKKDLINEIQRRKKFENYEILQDRRSTRSEHSSSSTDSRSFVK